MRRADDIELALTLAAQGASISSIARDVGISRSTVRQWLSSGDTLISGRQAKEQAFELCDRRCNAHDGADEAAYSYLLGQYLGDGCISAMGNSYRLRITCCDDYPGIMDECERAMSRIRPDGRVRRTRREGCTELGMYWSHWPCLLPHGSGGLKHQRSIELLDWQRQIAINAFPQQFLRGLIHSDGWRGTNRVRGANGCSYAYPRYMFSNRSEDIKRLFTEACRRLGVEARRMNAFAISVAKRESVATLDGFIGPKS